MSNQRRRSRWQGGGEYPKFQPGDQCYYRERKRNLERKLIIFVTKIRTKIRNYFKNENWIRTKIESTERKYELKLVIFLQTEFYYHNSYGCEVQQLWRTAKAQQASPTNSVSWQISCRQQHQGLHCPVAITKKQCKASWTAQGRRSWGDEGDMSPQYLDWGGRQRYRPPKLPHAISHINWHCRPTARTS